MGRVSRDARLTFILLWPQCDDHGRLRGNSRMLASLLFPCDEDAPEMIDRWLKELEDEGCIVRYETAGAPYLAVCNWSHQKIDHPSASKFPPPPSQKKPKKTKLSPREPSANARERSPLDQGSRTKEGIKDQGEDQGREPASQSDAPPLQGDLLSPSEPEVLPNPFPDKSRAIAAFATNDPLAQAVETYNVAAERHGWRQCRWPIEGSRKTNLLARLREVKLDGWVAMLLIAKATPFLCGENDRGWKPDLEWFAKKDNFRKVAEGKYASQAPKAESVMDRAAEAFALATGRLQ
jgi:hypothetical protein